MMKQVLVESQEFAFGHIKGDFDVSNGKHIIDNS